MAFGQHIWCSKMDFHYEWFVIMEMNGEMMADQDDNLGPCSWWGDLDDQQSRSLFWGTASIHYAFQSLEYFHHISISYSLIDILLSLNCEVSCKQDSLFLSHQLWLNAIEASFLNSCRSYHFCQGNWLPTTIRPKDLRMDEKKAIRAQVSRKLQKNTQLEHQVRRGWTLFFIFIKDEY